MARLGTHARPAVTRVQTEDRAQQIIELCAEHRWDVIVDVVPDQPEDITDVLQLQEPTLLTVRKEPLPGRNDPCTCGSGVKFKKCCLRTQASTSSQGMQNGET